MADLPLSRVFASNLPGGGATLATSEGLEQALRNVLEGAHQLLPDVALEDGEFLPFLAQRVGTAADPRAALETLHTADLYLACACARGDLRALAELDRRLVATVAPAVARLGPSFAFIEDVQQLLRQKLLVADGGSLPKILDYQGRGALSHWLRAAALRVALNLLESQKAGEKGGEDALEHLPATGPDPELALVKQRYGPEFKEALEAALEGLPARERNLLRLYFVQGLTVEQIGRMEGTHKSTVSRWLARSRTVLLDEVRHRLKERLSLSSAELDSLIGVLRSQLHLSLVRVLGKGDG